MSTVNFHIERYRKSRSFGLYCNDRLLCVTVYKRGAVAVRDTIQTILDSNPEAQACFAKFIGQVEVKGGDHV